MIRAWRCRRMAAALVDYGDHALLPRERARVERHLAGCPRCAAAVTALADVPARLRGAPAARDDVFWAAQRRHIMDAIRTDVAAPEPVRPRGFDWRLALPVAAAAAIAVAGYLSLRAPLVPSEVALDTLPPEDLAALVEVAEGFAPSPDVLLDAHSASGAIGGALDAGWIRTDDPAAAPAWSGLDDADLDTLTGIIG